jgi:hypothetical protein
MSANAITKIPKPSLSNALSHADVCNVAWNKPVAEKTCGNVST